MSAFFCAFFKRNWKTTAQGYFSSPFAFWQAKINGCFAPFGRSAFYGLFNFAYGRRAFFCRLSCCRCTRLALFLRRSTTPYHLNFYLTIFKGMSSGHTAQNFRSVRRGCTFWSFRATAYSRHTTTHGLLYSHFGGRIFFARANNTYWSNYSSS